MSGAETKPAMPFGPPAIAVTQETSSRLSLKLGAGAKPEYSAKVNLNAKEYDAIAESYAELTAQNAAAEQQRIEYAIKLHRSGNYAPQSDAPVVADLGGAYGRDSEVWRDAGYRHVVLDISLRLLQLGVQRNTETIFMLGDMVTTPFRDASIDIAWLSSSIQHVPGAELHALFEKISHALKPGGIGFVNYRQWDDEKEKNGFAKEGEIKSQEYRRADSGENALTRFMTHFTAMELAAVLSETGLAIITLKNYPAGYPVRKLDSKSRINSGDGSYPPAKGLIFFRLQ